MGRYPGRRNGARHRASASVPPHGPDAAPSPGSGLRHSIALNQGARTFVSASLAKAGGAKGSSKKASLNPQSR